MRRAWTQRIHYLRTADAVRIAWAEAGSGPPLVKAANWLTHLDFEWESPLWRHWLRFLCDHFRLVRYDERGCGMTDWNVGDLAFARWVDDLEAVVGAAAVSEPFTLLGISQGAATAIGYAVRHPDRVSRLVLYGGYVRGAARRGNVPSRNEFAAIVELARLGWGKENPAFRQIFTSRFVPNATEVQTQWFNELCRRTTSPEIAAELLEQRARVEVTDLLREVRTPTLVLHARKDGVVPIDEGRLIASEIQGAEFVELDSPNHILLEDEPAWDRLRGAVLDFAGIEPSAMRTSRFDTLTRRERTVLALISEGLGNEQIAKRLFLSEKTIRNYVSNVFAKLGVRTRAQAIVLARDGGFEPEG